ncbi:MAG TPA: metal-dependent hydrolase [Pyrinomonadaceae bacterium]|nr:metal-dependent hydrolase [Pyrinomonadaceae bacterium]
MPTIFTHAAAALAVGKASAGARKMPARFWLLTALCAVLPDADVVGFSYGLRGSVLGHRGLSHSLFFALLVALLVVFLAFRKARPFRTGWLVLYFFAVTASHGLLDALTDGGSGVAFFAPFDGARYFFPWRPIEVSPISLDRFFGPRGMEVMRSEIVWVWIPAAALVALAWLLRRLRVLAK